MPQEESQFHWSLTARPPGRPAPGLHSTLAEENDAELQEEGTNLCSAPSRVAAWPRGAALSLLDSWRGGRRPSGRP